MANVRIIDQPLITTLSGDEYLVTDSSTAGTKKITPQNLVNACSTGTGVSDDLKVALLQIAEKVAYIDDDGQQYYDDLYDALYDTTWQVTNTLSHCSSSNSATSVTKNGSYSATITASAGYTLTGATVSITMGGNDITSTAYSNGTISIASVTGALVISVSAAAKTVSSISAVYTQSGVVYPNTSLNSLKSDLVVTATYNDSSTGTVPSSEYTLSGTLTEGTSVVTVTYGGKTTTFNVTVSAQATVTSIEAVYTQSGTVYSTDSLNSLKADLEVTATWSDSEISTVPSSDYTLSGTLTAGTSTITVSYEGETDTFTVTVTAASEVTWAYTDGMPTVKGFTQYGSDGSESMTSSGLQITVSGSNKYRGYKYPNTDPTGYFEATFRLTTSQSKAYLGFGDGTNAIVVIAQYSSNYKGLYLYDGPMASATKLMTIATGTDYTVKVTMSNGYADVYVNGSQVASAVDVSTITYSGKDIRLLNISPSSSNSGVLLKEMKVKTGSTT